MAMGQLVTMLDPILHQLLSAARNGTALQNNQMTKKKYEKEKIKKPAPHTKFVLLSMKHTSNSGYVKLTIGEMSLDRRTVSSLLLCKSGLIYLKKTMEFRSGPILLGAKFRAKGN